VGQFDRAVADDAAGVATRARGLQVAEDPLEQPRLVEAHRLRRQREPLRRVLEPLLLRHAAQEVVHLPLHLPEAVDVGGVGEARERFEVDDRGPRVLERLAQLLQEPLDLVELLLQVDRLQRGERRLPGEGVARRHPLDLVADAERLDEPQEALRERARLVAAPPELLERGDVLVAERLREFLRERRRRRGRAGLARHGRLRVASRRVELIGLEELALPRLEQGDQRLEARPETLDLADVEANRVRQLLGGETSRPAVREQVLHRPGDEVVRRLVGRAEADRVVAEIDVVERHRVQRVS
jgi:hypothetical protein